MQNDYQFLYKNQEGIILCVKLVPNSSHNKIVDFNENYIRIKISSPPVENRANKELIAFLSCLLDVNKSKIQIVSGDKSKLKKVQIKDINFDVLSQKLLFVLDSVKKINKE